MGSHKKLSDQHRHSLNADQAIEQLAQRLAALPFEFNDNGYGGSGNMTPANSDVFDFSINNSYEFFDFGHHSNPWPMTSYADVAKYDRCGDTPKTWPNSDVGQLSPAFNSGTSTPANRNYGQHQRMNRVATIPFPMSQLDVEEWERALMPPKPGPGYICKICHRNDHYVQNCPVAPSREILNTPYQGHNKCFGIFACDCGREWNSHESWAQLGQFCRSCQRLVYPHQQYPLDKIPPSKLMKPKRGRGGRIRSAN